jgi:thymidylate kinase
MIPTNLILVDGIPGAGKSTTAQLLCLHLEKLGYHVNWIFEQDPKHPIYLFHEILASRQAKLRTDFRFMKRRWFIGGNLPNPCTTLTGS